MRVALLGAILAASLAISVAADEKIISAADCNFLVNQDQFLSAQARVRESVHLRAMKLEKGAAIRESQTVDPSSIERRNFIDEEIFGAMEKAGVASAPLSTDEEFLRRVPLDMTGRIPSPDDVRAFLGSDDPDKRHALIEKLIRSPEFSDKWTWWFADLLQINATASNVNRQLKGRN